MNEQFPKAEKMSAAVKEYTEAIKDLNANSIELGSSNPDAMKNKYFRKLQQLLWKAEKDETLTPEEKEKLTKTLNGLIDDEEKRSN